MVRNIRIYQPGSYAVGQELCLSASQGAHVGVVLRMLPGHALTLFAGDTREYSATILSVHKKNVVVRIDSECIIDCESPCQIHLAQAISKGDRMEWVIQKATELGVTSITPVLTSHCAVKIDHARLLKKQLHWQAVAIAACEQSGRTHVPVIATAIRLDVFLQQCQTNARWILHPRASQPWPMQKVPCQAATLLVGPEGGFDEAELQTACAMQFQPIKLGPRTLRTETAAIAAISILQMLYGDF